MYFRTIHSQFCFFYIFLINLINSDLIMSTNSFHFQLDNGIIFTSFYQHS